MHVHSIRMYQEEMKHTDAHRLRSYYINPGRPPGGPFFALFQTKSECGLDCQCGFAREESEKTETNTGNHAFALKEVSL